MSTQVKKDFCYIMQSKKHILIPGGAGFIGINLTKKLLGDGHKVTVWDNQYTSGESSVEFLESDRSENKNLAYENVDIRYEKSIECDIIINLACPASPVHYQKDPVYTWETSVLGIRNLLNLAETNKAMLLHASTSEIYGDPFIHPQVESYWGNVNPIGIRSCYDEGKRAAETLAMDYKRTRNVDTRLFRIFNTYGPYMQPDDGRVISNFCMQIINGETLTVYGDGKQTRSFCYVSDLVDGIIRLMELGDAPDGPINLGNQDEFTLLELIDLLGEVTGNKIDIKHMPLPMDDPLRRKPDISKATQVLGWKPEVPLKEGIVKTMEYFRSITV